MTFNDMIQKQRSMNHGIAKVSDEDMRLWSITRDDLIEEIKSAIQCDDCRFELVDGDMFMICDIMDCDPEYYYDEYNIQQNGTEIRINISDLAKKRLGWQFSGAMTWNTEIVKSKVKKRNIKKYGRRPWQDGDDIAYYIYRDGYRDIGRVNSFGEAIGFIWDAYDSWYDNHVNGNPYSNTYDRSNDFPINEYHLVEVNYTIYNHWREIGMEDIEPEDYEGKWYDFKWIAPYNEDDDWEIEITER